MGGSEKLGLQWNEFHNIVSSSFGDLRNDGDLTDVTLACEDGTQMEAHKVVLASTSPFFFNLLKRNKHPHPLIYMKGIKSDNLLAMIEFFYKGEADVSQENLEGFLALADEMKLKGLQRPEESTETLNQPQNSQPQMQTFEPDLFVRQHSKKKQDRKKSETQESRIHEFNTALAMTNSGSVEVTDVQLLGDQIKSMMERGENRIPVKKGNGKVKEEFTWICKVCGKEGRYSHLQRHIEAMHITGFNHTCDICGNKSRTKKSLHDHKSRYHGKDL